MIKLNCSSCQKLLSIDETKLPMKEVSFPCPSCKAKLTVDRRKLEGNGETTVAPDGSHEFDDDDDGDYEGVALLTGVDLPAVRTASKAIGFRPHYIADLKEAREFYVQEYPPIVFYRPAEMSAPPLQEMQPLLSLTPGDRRKSFFILVADNMRTLDGNAAFLYQVNLVVATKDLGNIKKIYRDASEFHRRLYHAMNANVATTV